MLRSARIRRFRSCGDVTLADLAPVTALLGRNGAGKSNILRALDWAARHASGGSTPDALFDDEGWSDGVSVELQFTIETTDYRYTIARDLKWKPQPEFTWHEDLESLGGRGRAKKLLLRRKGAMVDARGLAKAPLSIALNTPALGALLSLFPDAPESEPFSLVRGYLGHFRYYPLDEPERVALSDRFGFIKDDDYKKWRAEAGAAVGGALSVPMRMLQLSIEAPDVLAEVKHLLGKNGLDVVADITIDKHDETTFGFGVPVYSMSFRPSSFLEGTSSTISYADLSRGTRRLVRLLLGLVADGSSVMLIEQPEDAIHPGLLSKVIDLLKEYSDKRNIIVASHSPIVMNALPPEAIRLVTLSEGQTVARQLTPTERDVARDFIEDEGQLSDFIESVEN